MVDKIIPAIIGSMLGVLFFWIGFWLWWMYDVYGYWEENNDK